MSSGAVALPTFSTFGGGSGPIYFDSVECVGNCSHSGIGNHDCVHIQDASVRCPGSHSEFQAQVHTNVDQLFHISLFGMLPHSKWLWWCVQHWRCEASWRLIPVWRTSGNLHQWWMGDSVWWQLGWCWCQCHLLPAWILSYWYVVRHSDLESF